MITATRRRPPGGRIYRFVAALVGAAALSAALFAGAASAQIYSAPSLDPFYSYTGAKPLAEIKPGTVLKTRTLSYHVAGISTPVKAVQLLYRSTGATGKPVVNVTSVLEAPSTSSAPRKVVAYQSFYDSLNPSDEPSYAVTGGLTLGGLIPQVESLFIAPELLAGNAVVFADTEGEDADFAAGPEYGMLTLDSLKAALASPATGLSGATQVAMLGYSGGAIATEWAAELAPTYAPQLNEKLVGASIGGVLVDPAHNLSYVSGSLVWAGVMPMALIGIARAYGVDFTPYLNAYGVQLMNKLQSASITTVLAAYPGLTWAQIAKPAYPSPTDIQAYVTVANKLIMGTGGTPTTPLLIDQGADGWLDGTNGDVSGIGAGDGVMITGDVRTLASEYCSRGATVEYNEFDLLDHFGTAAPWLAQSIPWIAARFAGAPAPNDCSTIAAGNPLTPIS